MASFTKPSEDAKHSNESASKDPEAPQKMYFNWSTGKDSAFALYKIQQRPDLYHVATLVTSVNTTHDRVSMHGVRRTLLHRQSKALGIPLTTIELPNATVSMEDYQRIMKSKVDELVYQQKHTCTAFGDIFLEDLRKDREDKLRGHGVECVFPLWKMAPTATIMDDFLKLGFRCIVVSVSVEAFAKALRDESTNAEDYKELFEKAKNIAKDFAGREIDRQFLEDLPGKPGSRAAVDPCGENGEFHTFVFDGPIFKQTVKFTVGEKVYREYPNEEEGKEPYGYWFCDLLPG